MKNSNSLAGQAKFYIVGAIVIVLLAALGFFYMHSKGGKDVDDVTKAITASTTGATTTHPGYTIEQIPGEQVPTPSLDHKIVFGAAVPANVRPLMETGVASTTARLKKEPTDANDWFSLAIWYHEAEDFAAAKEVWVYLGKVVTPPGNAVALDNLGKLYHFDLKDYPKAESYFREAIAADPSAMNAYTDLYQLYLYSYKQNTTAVVDTLNQTAIKFPKSSTPYFLLGTYYEGKKETANARVALGKAMDIARTAGDTSAMSSIGTELAKLPQ